MTILLLLLPLAWAAAKDIPPLTGHVNDTASLIPEDQRQRIEAQLTEFEKQTGDQIAVLTVDSLDGEAIEDYANKVGRSWALGQKGKDNGAILLVSKADHKMRVEVGYGLEPVLTDLQTSIIQNQVIIPHFKQGDFGGGIAAGVDAILSTIQGKAVQPAPQAEPTGSGGRSNSWPGFLLFGLFALGPFILNAIRSGSWIVYLVVLPILFFLGSLASMTVGLIAAGVWLILFPILRMVLPKTSSSGGFRGPGGWWMGGPGGFGGGGGSFGGGGGGGFSGGGGSFGGGGSSSSW
ncbi:MAG TPA: TPM domain-containing protein [Thermoanaerobaculia bacterium]